MREDVKAEFEHAREMRAGIGDSIANLRQRVYKEEEKLDAAMIRGKANTENILSDIAILYSGMQAITELHTTCPICNKIGHTVDMLAVPLHILERHKPVTFSLRGLLDDKDCILVHPRCSPVAKGKEWVEKTEKKDGKKKV